VNEYAVTELKRVLSDRFVDLYCNSVRVSFTPWDFVITLSLVKEKGSDESPVVEDFAALRMSPQHYKAFLQVFQASVEGYEKRHGTIPMPKQDDEPS
jgi:hypothetical protein